MAGQEISISKPRVVPGALEPRDEGSPGALGDQIAQLRVARGLSQQRLADMIGISKGQLQVIERGWSDRAKRTPANPRLSTLVGLCRELGARIDVTYPDGIVVVIDDRDDET